MCLEVVELERKRRCETREISYDKVIRGGLYQNAEWGQINHSQIINT